MNQGVYCLTNLINGKRYIGLSTNIERRKRQHYTNSSSNENLQSDIKIYGIDNFEFSILEYVKDIDKLIERENYWLDFYKSSELYNKLKRPNRKQTNAEKKFIGRRNYLIDLWQTDVSRIKSKSTNYG